MVSMKLCESSHRVSQKLLNVRQGSNATASWSTIQCTVLYMPMTKCSAALCFAYDASGLITQVLPMSSSFLWTSNISPSNRGSCFGIDPGSPPIWTLYGDSRLSGVSRIWATKKERWSVGKCGLASIAYSGKENISYNPENETVVKSNNTL
jgi:hypothetical protein